MVVRNSDLILASDKSLRMTSLLEVKHKDQSSSASQGTFKELVSDALDFEIAGIILNPTGKLVAVVGSHKIVVVVLPRIGVSSGKSVGAKVSVKAATVGSFYFHERVGGRARLASVKWHPWGHLGSSLLVMSKDGLLRWVSGSASTDATSLILCFIENSMYRTTYRSQYKQCLCFRLRPKQRLCPLSGPKHG